jgi:hypothetical protein
MQKPQKVQAIAIYSLVLGIMHALAALGILAYGLIAGLVTFGIGCLFLVLFPLPAAAAVLEIVYATKLLPDPIKPTQMGKTVAYVEIACVLACFPLAVAAGIVSLVFYGDPEVKAYFEWANGQGAGAPPPPTPEPLDPGATMISPS